MYNDQMKYDLEERVEKFGEAVIDFVKALPKNELPRSLLRGSSLRFGIL